MPVVAPETVYTTSWRNPSRHVYLHFTCQGGPGRAQPDIHALPCDTVLRRLLTWARTRDQLHAQALALHALARLPASAWRRESSSPAVLAAQHLGRRYLHRLVGNDEFARAAGMHVNAFIPNNAVTGGSRGS